MEQFIDPLMRAGNRRLVVLVVAGAAMVAVTAAFFVGFTKPQMSLLFSDLTPSDAAQIVTQLETMDVPLKISADGSAIYAPHDKVSRLRMGLAEKGLPAGGTVGYELFDRNDTLGLTSFMQNVSRVRAMEGELARTIQTLASVDAARVHLVLADRDPFSRETSPPSASVVVRMRGAQTLDSNQASSIRHLVSSAVPNLDPGGVSVLDARHGTVFAEETGALAGASSVDGLRASIEQRLAQAVEAVLTPTVGPGNVRVRVAADLRTEREIQREERFDPNETVLRSRQTVDEVESSREKTNDDPVTVEQNLPEADVGADNDARASSEIERTEQTVNYEVSTIRKERVIEPGDVERLSVSVVVDHNRRRGEGGETITEPRSEEELRALTNLVKSAVGFDASRGDVVTMENLAFVDVGGGMTTDTGAQLTEAFTSNVDTFTRAALMFAFGLAVIFGVVRPALQRLIPANDDRSPETTPLEPVAGEGQAGEATGHEEDGHAQIEGGQQGAEGGNLALPRRSMDDTLSDMLEIRDVDGKVRASSVRKLGEISEQYPDEVVAILRSWVYEDAA